MAPAKATKRSPQAAAVKEPKKPKTDPLEVGVIDALRQAEGISEDCRAMLSAGVSGCFASPAESRHEHQATFISWLSTVMDSVQDKLREALEIADAEEAGAEAKTKELEGKIEEAKAVVNAEEEAVAAKESSLKEASTALASAHAELQSRQKAQQDDEAQLAEVIKDKELLDRVLEEDVSFLNKDEGYDATQAAERARTLLPIAKRLDLDDSLMAALLPAATKPPSTRGAFDIMVLGTLEESMKRKAVERQGQLEAAEPSKKALAAATETAQASLRQAEEAAASAEAALAAARLRQGPAAAALREAEQALEAFQAGRSEATAAREQKAAALQNFVGYNMECFKLLCARGAQSAQGGA